MTDKTPRGSYLGFLKEDGFRMGDGTFAAPTMTTVNAFDVLATPPDPPLTYRNREEYNEIGEGRNVARIAELGYNVGEISLEFALMTSIMLYFALGACTTTGVSAPYTHTISEANVLPTMCLRYQSDLDPTSPGTDGEDVGKNIFGVAVANLTITIEQDAEVRMTVDLMAAKALDATASAKPTRFTLNAFHYADFDQTTSVLTYNSASLLGTDGWRDVDMIEITITNDIELRKALGDAYAAKFVVGKREYGLRLHLYPAKHNTLLDLRNTHIEDYLTDIDCVIKLGDVQATPANHAITFTFDKLYLSDFPDHIPDWDEKILGVDIEFRLAPGGSLGVVGLDNLDDGYYEITP